GLGAPLRPGDRGPIGPPGEIGSKGVGGRLHPVVEQGGEAWDGGGEGRCGGDGPELLLGVALELVLQLFDGARELGVLPVLEQAAERDAVHVAPRIAKGIGAGSLDERPPSRQGRRRYVDHRSFPDGPSLFYLRVVFLHLSARSAIHSIADDAARGDDADAEEPNPQSLPGPAHRRSLVLWFAFSIAPCWRRLPAVIR